MKQNKKIDFIFNEKGQVLLFVIVAMTIALVIGISIAYQALRTARRIANTDTSSKVYSASESGVEFMLAQSDATLASIVANRNNCPNPSTSYALGSQNGVIGICRLDLIDTTDAALDTQTLVSVSKFAYTYQEGSNYVLDFNLYPGDVREIFLRNSNGSLYNGTVQFCWASLDQNIPSALGYYFYNSTGVLNDDSVPNNYRNFIYKNASDVSGNYVSWLTTNGNDCLSAPVSVDSATGLRVRSLYGPAKVQIKFNTLPPDQGYLIQSTGRLFSAQNVPVTKKIKVYRTFRFMPASFDYTLYSQDILGE